MNYSQHIAPYQGEPLSEFEERLLIHRAQSSYDSARTKLVQSHLAYINKKVRDFARNFTDDLFQQGVLGFLHAVDSMDPNRSIRLTTYSAFYIKKYVHQHLEKDPGRSHHDMRRIRRIHEAIQTLHQEDQSVTTKTIAEQLNEPIGSVRAVLQLAGSPDSLDKEDEQDHDPHERIGRADNPVCDSNELKSLLREGLDHLEEPRGTVVRRYFGLDGKEPDNYYELGDRLEYSKSRIGQFLEEALDALRSFLTEHGYTAQFIPEKRFTITP